MFRSALTTSGEGYIISHELPGVEVLHIDKNWVDLELFPTTVGNTRSMAREGLSSGTWAVLLSRYSPVECEETRRRMQPTSDETACFRGSQIQPTRRGWVARLHRRTTSPKHVMHPQQMICVVFPHTVCVNSEPRSAERLVSSFCLSCSAQMQAQDLTSNVRV